MEQISNQHNDLSEPRSLPDPQDLSNQSFPNSSSSEELENMKSHVVADSSRQRLNDFLDIVSFRKGPRSPAELRQLTEEYFQQLSDEKEIVLALNRMGGGQYYRPPIPRDVSITLLAKFLRMNNEDILVAAIDASIRLSCVDEYSDEILKLSQHVNPNIRNISLSAMGSGSNPDFHEILVRSLKNEIPELMWTAGLSLIKGPIKEETIQALKPLLNEKCSDLRQVVVSVLGYYAFVVDDMALQNELQRDLVLRLFDSEQAVIERTVKTIWQYASPSDLNNSKLKKALAAHMHIAREDHKIKCAQALLRFAAREYAPMLNSMLLDPQRDNAFKLAMIHAIRTEDRALFLPTLQLLAQDPGSSERLLREIRLRFP